MSDTTKALRERVQHELLSSRRLQDVGMILLGLLDYIAKQDERIAKLEEHVADFERREAGPYATFDSVYNAPGSS
jgi:hypothetical protein